MLIRTGLFASLILFLIGAGWYVARVLDKRFISEAACTSRVQVAVQQINDKLEGALNDNLKLADEIEKDVDAIELHVSHDVERLCEQAASCRDRDE